MPDRRLQVPSKGEYVHVVIPQFLHGSTYIVVRLPQSQHEGRLGEEVRVVQGLLGVSQDGQGLLVVGPAITHPVLQTLHGFYVMGVNVQSGSGHPLDQIQLPPKVRCDIFHDE